MGEINADTGYLKMKEWLPYADKEMLIKCKWGLRKAIWKIGFFGLLFTDCTHPMQNRYCSYYDVYEWRYVNEEDMNNLLFVKNTWMRGSEGNQILNEVLNKKSLFKKIYQWLIKVLK